MQKLTPRRLKCTWFWNSAVSWFISFPLCKKCCNCNTTASTGLFFLSADGWSDSQFFFLFKVHAEVRIWTALTWNTLCIPPLLSHPASDLKAQCGELQRALLAWNGITKYTCALSWINSVKINNCCVFICFFGVFLPWDGAKSYTMGL